MEVSMSRWLVSLLGVLLLVTVALGTDPALERGSVLVQGQFSYEKFTYGTSSSQEIITFTPAGYYFPIKQLGVGGRVMATARPYSATRATSIAGGPELAYFLEFPRLLVYPYVNGAVMYNHTEYENQSSIYTRSGLDIKLGIGICNIIASRVALMMEVGYKIHGELGSSNDYGQTFAVVGFGGFLNR
jgi:hypothetical protein